MMRIHPTRLIRSLFSVVIVLFVFLNMHILFSSPSHYLEHPELVQLSNYHNPGDPHVQFKEDRTKESRESELQPQLVIAPNQYNKTPSHSQFSVDHTNLTMIKLELDMMNEQQFIHNLNKYGLRLNLESVVIVVQVHDRLEYLKILLDSLRAVRKIEESLLIISHDMFSAGLNKLVMSVDFCPVMQIFYPVSAQLHPKEFPGEHPNDCSRNVKKEEALKIGCNNAEHPDKYGHYREAKYCQTKHHWFWKLHHVFDKLTVMKDYEGMVLLLEEDYYVTPDVIIVLQMMQNLQKRDCKECKMLAVGNYDKTQNYAVNSGKVEVGHWISSKHNMGMAFTRSLWEEIKACEKEFCLFDDYNWDWTLQHLSSKCIPGQIRVLKIKATRVYHMGDCGVHHKGKNCHPDEKKKKVEATFEANKHNFFPNVLSIGGYSKFKLRDPKPNGGWGDIRDQNLCLSFLSNDQG